MDLEAIVRAIWRRRGRVLLCVVAFAIAVPLGYGALFKPEYESSSDVTVYPPRLTNTAVTGPYNLNPDRYVATEVAVMSSHASAAKVGAELRLSATEVAKMVTISQIPKSDAIRVTASSTDAKLAAAVAAKLAQNFVTSTADTTRGVYQQQLKSVNDQLAAIATSIQTATSQIGATGSNASDPGALQTRLNDLYSQQASLVDKQQSYTLASLTADQNTQVVSNATVSDVPTNTSKKTLAIYGGAFGFGLAVLVISLSTVPGRTLEELDFVEEVEGVEVIGVLEPKRQKSKDTGMQNVHGLRIGSELRTIIRQKGQITLVPLGRFDRMSRASDVVVRLIAGHKIQSDEVDEIGVLRTDSLEAFLGSPEPESQRVVLSVDLERISRRDLVDTLITLDSLGTEVMGLVGIR